MKHMTEPKKTVCTCQDGKHCCICGSLYRNIAFKGSYVCESCVDYIKGRDLEPK